MRFRSACAACLMLLTLLLGPVPASGLAGAASSNPDQPVTLPGHRVAVPRGATPVARPQAALSAAPRMQVTVVLNRSDEAGFQAYLQAVQDPHAASYRQFLTQSQLANRFGPSAAAYGAVLDYLQQQGLTLVRGSDHRTTITVSGTRDQVSRAFGVHLSDYQLNGRTFHMNDGDPSVPARIAPYVQAIVGLSSLAQPKPGYSTSAATAPQATSSSSTCPVNGSSPTGLPCGLATAYNFGGVTAPNGSAATGAGQKIGLIEFDNYYDADFQSWLNLVGLPSSLSSNVSRNFIGGSAVPVGSDDVEVLGDLSAVVGLAPGAQVTVYETPNNGSASFIDLFNAAIADHATVISNSWGACESAVSQAEATATDSVLATAAASGIAVYTASGDQGASCVTGSAGPNFPADTPHGVAVGGTTLNVNQDGSYQGETWWATSATGSGGFGVSCCTANGAGFARPSYQDGLTSTSGRSLPDVSANGDPSRGVYFCEAVVAPCGTTVYRFGGTSLAAPVWAAGTALLNQAHGPVGNLNQLLYTPSVRAAFHAPGGTGTSNFAHLGLGSFNLGAVSNAIGQAIATPTSTPSTCSSTLSLESGWNLVSFSVTPGTAAVTSVLAPIAGQYDTVYGFDPTGGGTTSYFTDPSKAILNNLSTLQPLQGYWLHMTHASTLTVTGTCLSPAASISLQPGWNLIGWAGVTAPVTSALAGLGSGYDTVYGFDPEDGGTTSYFTDPSKAILNNLTVFVPGQGYWVHVVSATPMAFHPQVDLSATPSPDSTLTPTPTASASPSPSSTPPATSTVTLAATPTVTAQPTATSTPTALAAASPTPDQAATASATATVVPSPSSSPTTAGTAAPTTTPSARPTP